MNKTFKGKLADQGQLRIRLSTNNGLTGYKIIKFLAFPAGSTSNFSYESFIQLFSTERDSVPGDGVPDFDDPTLLAAAYYTQSASGATNPEDLTVVFDTKVINQDVFITHSNSEGSSAINFYIELEQVKLSKDEATMATLKDMRAGPDTNFGP